MLLSIITSFLRAYEINRIAGHTVGCGKVFLAGTFQVFYATIISAIIPTNDEHNDTTNKPSPPDLRISTSNNLYPKLDFEKLKLKHLQSFKPTAENVPSAPEEQNGKKEEAIELTPFLC
jgi:hypothetical protein